MTDVLFEFAANPPLPPDQRQRICDWLVSVGVDPNRVREGRVEADAGGYVLHLTEKQLNTDGRTFIDPATNEVAVAQRAVRLGDRADWPGAEAGRGDHPGDDAPGG